MSNDHDMISIMKYIITNAYYKGNTLNWILDFRKENTLGRLKSTDIENII